ncbi:expansin-YoaJ-like isoform X1 [Biomphalaria pfeifferi]|uniref:Expansin-YoaJ-like isoform X1 n=1 Tax=Biomphalaria pfeifferi TaxID=112525 RepID=A0AAD8FAJ6_BIOPF|nr:expansin-YoaJ-like isoform X1 [Biomphalaria pfeifferi]
MSLALGLSVLLVLALSNAQPGVKNQDVLNLYSKSFNGDGTYYGEGIGGTCQYGRPLPHAATDPKISALVALNKPQFLNSLTCGICLKVTGTGHGSGANPITGEHIVFVKDLCPECHEGSVDFALNGDGRWSISMRAVQCPVGSSTIQYAFQGSNPYYLKLQIRNARIPITGVQVHRNNVWVTMHHSGDGYWLLNDSHAMPAGAFGIRLTAANGHVLEDTVPRIDNDHILEGGHRVQVPLDPSLPQA